LKKIIHFLFILVFVLACKKGQQAVEVVIEDANYNKAISFFNQNNDSAFYYFNEVATNSKDSLHVATAYNYMAVIQADAGDYFGSIESLTRSLSFLDERKKEDSSCLASDYNELGLNNIHLGRYDESIRFYDLALKYATNKPYKLIVLNNKGYAYREKKNYTQAIKIFDEILAQNQLDKREYARSLTNMSFTKWLQNPNYKAATNFLRALHIREKEKDLWGQNSSYAHLADYYAKNKRDSALWYARKMYRVAKRLESPNDQIEALQKLIKLSASDSSKFYFDVYQQLNDSVQLARSAAKNQFALIRYEVEKNKADNLRLQKENAEKVYQINKQRTLTAVVVFLMVIFVICAIFWYKKRKQRLELEAQNQIKEHQLKTSKKVHDVVANGIYRVMAEIENQNQIDREGILNRLENMYEKSRDISYEAEESLVNQPFNEKNSCNAQILCYSNYRHHYCQK